MKMKFIEDNFDYNESDLFYIGYYEDKPYALAQDRKYIINYMENHRGLSKDEYIIMEDNLDNYEFAELMDLLIYESHGFYLPDRDIKIAMLSFQTMEVELEHAYFSLMNLSKIIGQLKTEDLSRDKLIDAADAISRLNLSKKKMKKMNRISFALCPVIYCDMQKYHNILRDYEDRIERRDAWYMD